MEENKETSVDVRAENKIVKDVLLAVSALLIIVMLVLLVEIHRNTAYMSRLVKDAYSASVQTQQDVHEIWVIYQSIGGVSNGSGGTGGQSQ